MLRRVGGNHRSALTKGGRERPGQLPDTSIPSIWLTLVDPAGKLLVRFEKVSDLLARFLSVINRHFGGLFDALADVLALEGTIFSYIAAARKVDRGAANALIPYAAWVAFATVLNAEILRLNPHER